MTTRRTLLTLLVTLVALFAPTLAPAGATPAQANPAPRGAELISVTPVADRQVDLTVRSAALGGRQVKVRLLTPDGWNPDDRSQHWPTLWLLHGCCGDYTSWTKATEVEDFPELRKVLVVMPEAGWNGWYSDWWNQGSNIGDNWETFHTVELRQLLEKQFGASPNRTVAGLSMGGQGALLYAARHPGMFRAAAAYSGSVHPLLAKESSDRLMRFFAHDGNDPTNVWGDPVAQRDIWEAHDPYYIPQHLKSIPVYLSVGNGQPGPYDRPGSHDALEADFARQNEALAARLRDLGAKNLTTNFYGPGQHKWAYWERELRASLPMLLDAMNVR